MKVDGINKTSAIGANDKTTESKTSYSLNFQEMLDKQVASTCKPTAASAPSMVNPVVPTSTQIKTSGLELSESTINTLDNFAAALQNNSLSARDLEPYISALEEETLALLEVKDQLPANDSLAALLERVATVSYVETVKFRRGYYS